MRAGATAPPGVSCLQDIDLEVVECGDASDGVVDRLTPAPALAEDLVVFEPGDGVLCDGPAFAARR